jgi:pyruvate/2-oxoglutarate dehydrogenase complex dihydrolipoamide dehydrogenase (E3) component
LSDDQNSYKAAIIGTGQGGEPLAIALAKAGWKTALIERAHLGGSCVNFGCTPTKTMVASARVAHLARIAGRYGVKTGNVNIDLARVRERKRDVVNSFRGGIEKRVSKTENLDLLRGEASFNSRREIKIRLKDGDEKVISAEKIIIDTGTRTHIPPIEGIMDIPWLESGSIMELDSVPENLLIMGGGYIGLEFGQMFRRFDSKVTILQRAARLVPREDPDVSDEIGKIFDEDGINILFGAEARSAQKLDDGKIKLRVETNEGIKEIIGSHLLLAPGRTPNTDMLNLESAGIKSNERGFIQVNDTLQTSVEDIYAIGDVKGGPAFTHISYDDYRILKDILLDGKKRTIRDRIVPYTIFIDPQLGRVGITESEAKARDLNYSVAKLSMSHVARALETGETRGFMKAIVDNDSKKILGCAILSVGGGEVMNVLEVAMIGGLPYTVLRDLTIAHPTIGESLNNLFMTLDI